MWLFFFFFFKSGFISKGHSQRAVNYIRQNETWWVEQKVSFLLSLTSEEATAYIIKENKSGVHNNRAGKLRCSIKRSPEDTPNPDGQGNKREMLRHGASKRRCILPGNLVRRATPRAGAWGPWAGAWGPWALPRGGCHPCCGPPLPMTSSQGPHSAAERAFQSMTPTSLPWLDSCWTPQTQGWKYRRWRKATLIALRTTL